MNLHKEALNWQNNHGMTVLPVRPDGKKMPGFRNTNIAWSPYKTRKPNPTELEQWFSPGNTDGIGTMTGTISGNLEMLEFEGRAMHLAAPFKQAMLDHGASELWDTIFDNGYVEVSPSGGIHILYRVTEKARPNTKLARRPSTPEELTENPDQKVQVMIETRGEGGFTVLAPSAGRSHPSGKPWLAVKGTPGSIPTISAANRDLIYAIATIFDEMPARNDAPPRTPRSDGTLDGDRPGDTYNQKTDWAEILEPQGWTKCHAMGSTQAWTRPGKNPLAGPSATTGRNEGDNLYIFTSSTDLPTEEPLTKFYVYAHYHHDGKLDEAASQLRKDGYGTESTIDPAVEAIARNIASHTKETPWTPSASNSTLTTSQPTLPSPSETASPAKAPDESPSSSSSPDPKTATGATTSPAPDAPPAKEPAPKKPAERNIPTYTDHGNATRLLAEHGQHIRYCADRGRWLHWNGQKWEWQPDNSAAVRELAKQTMVNMETPDAESRRHRNKSLSNGGITSMLAMAETSPGIIIPFDQLDNRAHELNTPTGIINLATGELMPHDPARHHTKITATSMDPGQATPAWKAFLDTIFQYNQTLIDYFQRLCGYAATGDSSHQILPFFFGTGQNGKSQAMGVLIGLLGDYADAAPRGLLTVGPKAHETEIASLQGLRAAVVGELNEEDQFDEAKTKLLSGGDRLKARYMHRDHFSFDPTHTLMIMGNYKPKVTSGGDSFWRRLRIIPFNYRVPDEDKVPDLDKILIKEEGPGILAWIIEGARLSLADGLQDPPEVLAATHQYAEEEDSLGRFIADRCHQGDPTVVRINTTLLLREYSDWCRENHEPDLSPQAFGRRIKSQYGIGVAKSHGDRYYIGITILSKENEPNPALWMDTDQ